MHEISLLEQVIKTILEDLRAKGVTRSEEVKEITLEVGALELHSEESFRQAFRSLAKGTLLANAKLKLDITPPLIECIRCGFKGACDDQSVDHHDPMPSVCCPQCRELTLLSGGRGVGKIIIE